MNKRKIILFIICFLISYFLIRTCRKSNSESNLQNTESSNSKISEPNYDSINKKVLVEIKKEPKIKDAVITEANVLYVAVIDDGTKRDGYASYCCEVLRGFQTNIKRVKVVEFGTMNSKNRDNAYGRLLGEATCE